MGRGVPITSGCENQCGLHLGEKEGCQNPLDLEEKVFRFKGLNMDSLSHKITHTGLQCRGMSLTRAMDKWERTEFTCFRVRAEEQGSGQLSPGTEALAGAIAPLLSPPLPSQ